MRSALLALLLFASCMQGGSQENEHPSQAVKHYPLHNYFGVNAFEWDFINPPDPLNLDTVRLNAIKHFTQVRHYLDWEKVEHTEGQYTFNPASNGSWNYDTMYQWCHDNGIEVLACIKTVPDWMQASWPEKERGNENVPVRYGRDYGTPASYIEQARLAFQYAARYGHNKVVDRSLVRVDEAIKPWPGGPHNVVKTGLGLIRYIECDNERDKWWQGRRAEQKPEEYAANLSAFYDGHKGTMGKGVGVKNADPSMKVVMGGLAAPRPEYVKAMIDWCLKNRGRRADGSPDLPWDVINYHYYCNDADYNTAKKQTTGMPPEQTKAAEVAERFVEMAHKYAGDMPVWVTETGYDIKQTTQQKIPLIGNKSVLETQADWSLRTCLLFSRAGIQKVFFYELFDDNPQSDMNFSNSGLINADRSPRPVADYMAQVNKMFGQYTYALSLSSDPVVDKYTLSGKDMYVLYLPSQQGLSKSFTLDLGKADSVDIFTPDSGPSATKLRVQAVTNGKILLPIGETPQFVFAHNLH